MKYVGIDGVNLPVSNIVLGGPFGERSDAESFAILDCFVSKGGTAIETANSYADGAAEEQIGRWLHARRCRASVVLFTKVCHPRGSELPSITNLVQEVNASRSRLGVDLIDVVLIHRDPIRDSARTVLAALEPLRARGVLSAFGVCNITRQRLDAFAEAKVSGKTHGLSIVSNYYGLAQQVREPWPGVLKLSEAEICWVVREDCPVLSWSALAQGWFAYRTLPSGFEDVYKTPINEERRKRAQALAQTLGASALQVALGFAFAAPFRLLASVGPRSTVELEEIAGVSALSLTSDQCRYLEGGSTQYDES